MAQAVLRIGWLYSEKRVQVERKPRGLLGAFVVGLAFHPDYARNGRLFVHYSRAGDGEITVEAAGEILNVFDSERISAWRYAQEWSKRTSAKARLVPLPWLGASCLVGMASLGNRILFSGKGKLPSVLDAPRFEARFKPLRFPNDRLLRTLGPQRLTWKQALSRTYE